jgi:D-serine dehydratase
MNAYELAEKMDDSEPTHTLMGLASVMLRQQADELNKVIPQLVKANGLIENMRIHISELEDKVRRKTRCTCGASIGHPLVPKCICRS